MKFSPKAFLSAIAFISFFYIPHEAFASKADELTLSAEFDPVIRFLVAGTAGASSMTRQGDDNVSWSYAVGMSAEISLAGAGLTPILQAGYFFQNKQWFHSIPVDIGGRYVWTRGKFDTYASGGMSLFVADEKFEDESGETTGDWEVAPLVYIDLGTRIMFKRHIGLEVRVEYRTYVVMNIIGLKLGLAI